MIDMHDAVDLINESLAQVAEAMGMSEQELARRVRELDDEQDDD